MIAPPSETVEVVYYDPEFTRLYRLETHVPEVGEVVGDGKYEVKRIRVGGARFMGHRIFYVYLRRKTCLLNR